MIDLPVELIEIIFSFTYYTPKNFFNCVLISKKAHNILVNMYKNNKNNLKRLLEINIKEDNLDLLDENNIGKSIIQKFSLSHGSNISNEKLKLFKNVIELTIMDSDNITNDGINNLENIESIVITDTKITGSCFKNLKKIKRIHIHGHKSTENIENGHLSNLDLDYFRISYNNKITDEGIKNFKKIKELGLVSCEKITGECLCEFKNLICLKLAFQYISEKYIRTITTLEELSLHECCIEDFSFLSDLVNLKDLTINDSEYIRDNDLNLKKLENLILVNCIKVTGSCFENLINLNKITIKKCPRFDPKNLKKLKNIKNIELHNFIIKLTESNNYNIHNLVFNNCIITSSALRYIDNTLQKKFRESNDTMNITKTKVNENKRPLILITEIVIGTKDFVKINNFILNKCYIDICE